ncbi:MAG: hypothetical protein P8X80_14820 [Desulfobacterales bacterium]
MQEIERNLAEPVDLFASGRWKPDLTPRVFEKYKNILRKSKGRDTERFDPAGYLAEVGLPQSLTAGRTNSDVLRAFHFVKAYRPDARYFPFSKRTGALVQKLFLSISRICPCLVIAFLVTAASGRVERLRWLSTGWGARRSRKHGKYRSGPPCQ